LRICIRVVTVLKEETDKMRELLARLFKGEEGQDLT